LKYCIPSFDGRLPCVGTSPPTTPAAVPDPADGPGQAVSCSRRRSGRAFREGIDIERARTQEAVRVTRLVARTNTNLGIILLLSPLAAVAAGEALRDGLLRLLARLDVADACAAYEAIRLANPGRMGRGGRLARIVGRRLARLNAPVPGAANQQHKWTINDRGTVPTYSSPHPPRLPHLQLDDGRELSPCREAPDQRTPDSAEDSGRPGARGACRHHAGRGRRTDDPGDIPRPPRGSPE
jgi:hypothetical protein